MVLKLGIRISYLQTNTHLLPQQPQLGLPPRSLHSSHQPPPPGRRLLLKQSSMSPCAGFMYHGSPLFYQSLVLSLLKGRNLQMAYNQSLKSLGLFRLLENSEIVSSGDIAALVYLWNPFTIISCVWSTSPIENLVVMMYLYGACTVYTTSSIGSFWMGCSNTFVSVSCYSDSTGYGPDVPPRKLLLQRNSVNLEMPSQVKALSKTRN